jgi:HEAT repeat protein
MSSRLEKAFDILRSEGDLPPSALQGLSDMNAAAAEEARRRWTRLAVDRRQAAMLLAGSLANEHIELNFDRLALIGLSDADPEVRRQAVANLWESEDPSLPQRFIKLLQTDGDLGVRAEAARALGRFVLELEEHEAVGEDRRRLEDALLAAAAGPDDRLRLLAIESLGFSSRAEVPVLIQAAFDSPGDEARRSALVAMGRSGDRRWRDVVIAELRSPAPSARREAAHAAGELELRPSIPELIELLEDVNPEVQLQAIWSLGQIGGKTAERALLRAQRSADDEAVRIALQESLEHLTFLAGTRHLEAALRARRESE